MNVKHMIIAATVLTLSAAIVAIPRQGVAGNETISQSAIAIPYTAILLDQAEDPIDGNYSITVDMYDGDDHIYNEEHVNAVVTHGRVQLILGTGDTDEVLSADLILQHPALEIQLEIDGSPIGPRTVIGYAPRAVRAQRVPATGVRYGDEYGYVPAQALEQAIYVAHGNYETDEGVETPAGMPEEFSCTHTAQAEVGIAGTNYAPDVHAQDRWGAVVGAQVIDAGAFAFKRPGDWAPNGSIVTVLHAHTDCEGENCQWELDVVPDGRADVTTICAFTGE